MTKIIHVVGARPNFMKAAPVIEAIKAHGAIQQLLINTGQHYDDSMAGTFFRDLSLPVPDRDLGVGSDTHAAQTARIMIAFEQVCLVERPDLVVVVGDVNSTLAAALVSAKLRIPVAHVEAGLRSFDWSMPEEINRIVTDRLSHVLLTPSHDANENLKQEGIPDERVHLVGNVMIDPLLRYLPCAGFDRVRSQFPIREREYAVLTLHRPSNVDDPTTFASILQAIDGIGERMPVVFPAHPRTQKRVAEFRLENRMTHVITCEPLGYLDFLSLVAHSRIALTDSGGLQEETTVLGIPCLTLRENTERPITVTHGTNRVVGSRTNAILAAFEESLRAPVNGRRPELWDGKTGPRIASVLRRFLAA